MIIVRAAILAAALSVSVGSAHAQTVFFSESFDDSGLASRGWYDNTSPILSSTTHVAGSVRSVEFRFLTGRTTAVNGGALICRAGPDRDTGRTSS